MKKLLQSSGLLSVVLEWLGFAVCLGLVPINIHEPGSQYGYYDETRIAFGLTFTISSIFLILYAIHLKKLWSPSVIPAATAGVFFVIMAWIPYQPNKGLQLDIHTVSIALASLAYAILVAGLGSQSLNKQISRISKWFFIIICLSVISCIFTRMLGILILVAQLVTIVSAQVWLILVALVDTEPQEAT